MANAMLVFNSWLKDIKMCIQELRLSNLEAVHLIKDYTSDNARGTVEFYLDTNSTWNYKALIEHLRTSFETVKSFSSVLVQISTVEASAIKKLRISLQMNYKY